MDGTSVPPIFVKSSDVGRLIFSYANWHGKWSEFYAEAWPRHLDVGYHGRARGYLLHELSIG